MTEYKRIHMAGVELEGGWNTRPRALHYDGSVNVRAEWTGEVASPPLVPTQIATWIRDNYPNACNETCGLHVHVSVRTPYQYARLMEPELQRILTMRLETWAKNVTVPGSPGKGLRPDHPFWARLQGKNIYCTNTFCPELQVWHVNKPPGPERDGRDDPQLWSSAITTNRYTQLNYPYRRLRTVECRLLPMFADSAVAVSAVEVILDTFNRFLRSKLGRCARKTTTVVTNETLNAEPPEIHTNTLDLCPTSPQINTSLVDLSAVNVCNQPLAVTPSSALPPVLFVMNAEERTARIHALEECSASGCDDCAVERAVELALLR